MTFISQIYLVTIKLSKNEKIISVIINNDGVAPY